MAEPPAQKILLADDHAISRLMLARWLESWGYKVIAVTDGAAALDALRQDPEIRLAVLDWVMPKMDGPDVCRALRAGSSEHYVYVVLVTARDSRDDVIAGLESGADDYLKKPYDALELEVRLRTGCRLIELQQELVRAREALRYEAMHDALTGLLNRGAVMSLLDRELARSTRSNEPLSVILGDLDRFKSINDDHGHAAGDAVLREASRRISTAVRPYDVIGRIGGEEFLIVLPGCNAAAGLSVANRLRIRVGAGAMTSGSATIQIGISLGIAGTDQYAGATRDHLVRTADTALYRAKRGGRNRAILALSEDWLSSGSSGAFPRVGPQPGDARGP
jgi:two-component system, cell cycle response regulator